MGVKQKFHYYIDERLKLEGKTRIWAFMMFDV